MAIISTNFKNNNKYNYTELIEQHKLRFYKTAKTILKNDDDVYDALQDALLSIYQNFEKLNQKEYFSTWATRIVINKCYDLLRKNKRQQISFEEINESSVQIAQYDEYEFDKYVIKNAIDSLNENLRLIVILYYYDDISITEISKIVNIPEGTVKSRLSKAREILKEKLKKEEI